MFQRYSYVQKITNAQTIAVTVLFMKTNHIHFIDNYIKYVYYWYIIWYIYPELHTKK